MRRTAINIYRPRALLVLLVAAVLAAMALVGVMASSSGAAAGDTIRISVSSSGTQGNARSSGGAFSADGRYVAFSSCASNLVTNDTNQLDPSKPCTGEDVFVRDRDAGTTEQVSVGPKNTDGSETQANGSSSGVISISADGRYVAFSSSASNLVADDNNGVSDVFVRDRDAGTTERVSVSSSESEGNGSSFGMSMSADGRYFAFYSEATDLVNDELNGGWHVFVRDRDMGTTEWVSTSSSELQNGSNLSRISMSDDGRYIAFSSQDNLVDDDTNGKPDVFVLDSDTEMTERVSVSSSETQANDFGQNDPEIGSRQPIISADGRYVAFESVAADLVAGDTNGGDDAFVRDRQLGTTERVSVDSCGKERENTASFPLTYLSMSADGLSVGFATYARNLVVGDTGITLDVFVHDRDTGTTDRVNVSSSGAPADRSTSGHSISADGRYAAFTTDATNLVSGDTNGVTDVFVHERRDTTQQSDKCVPTTTASATIVSGAAYESGTWTTEDVEVTLSAQDNEGGSGVKEIRYSATGAQSIAETVYDPRNPLLINTEGTTTISYFAIDNVGNRSQTKTFTVKIDRGPPLAPAITNPANNSYDTDGDFTVSGTAEANSTVELFEGTTSLGTTTADASGQWSKWLTGVSEGTHTYTAKAKDAAGKTSDPSDALTVIVEKTSPTLDTDNSDGSDSVEPDNGATGVSRDVTPTATFSDEMEPSSLTTSVKLYQRKSGKWRLVRDTKVSCEDDPCHTVTLDPYPTDPTRLLAANKRFKVTVTTGAKNLAGLPMSSNKSWTFTTGE